MSWIEYTHTCKIKYNGGGVPRVFERLSIVGGTKYRNSITIVVIKNESKHRETIFYRDSNHMI